jgi:hypothetical protein
MRKNIKLAKRKSLKRLRSNCLRRYRPMAEILLVGEVFLLYTHQSHNGIIEGHLSGHMANNDLPHCLM